MKLIWAPTSPFVRKVMLAIHELGIADRFELVSTTPDTVVDDVSPDNPLAQIPTLILDNGTAIYDGYVIIDYLNRQEDGNLIPADGTARTECLCRHALAQGLMETIISRLYQTRLPEDERSPSTDAKLAARAERALNQLEVEAVAFSGFGLAEITTVCALAYLDKRFADADWRPGRPALANWMASIADRPSVQATKPE